MRGQSVALIAAVAAVAGLVPTATASSESTVRDVRLYANPPLLNSVKRTMKGEKRDGTCVWSVPELTLAKGQRALAAQQVSADYTSCTTVVEIGEPLAVNPATDEELGSEAPRPVERATRRGGRGPAALQPARAAAYVNSQAYYRVTWYDLPGFTLNYVRSILNWTWGNGNPCVLGSTQSWATYAQVGTGWYRSGLNPWKTTTCQSHYGHVDADFTNTLFCTPFVYAHYRDVRIRGGYLGGYGGQVGSTWVDGGVCAPLHWGAVLVKEW